MWFILTCSSNLALFNIWWRVGALGGVCQILIIFNNNFNNIFFEEQHASGCRLITPALGISSWEMSLPCRAHFGALYLPVTWETYSWDPGGANSNNINAFFECTCHPALWPLHYRKTNLSECFLVFPWSVPAHLRDAVLSWLPHAGLHGRLGTLFVT